MNDNNKKAVKLLNIEYLRVYAVLSLLIWHCFFCPDLCWRLSENEFTSPFVHKMLYIVSAVFIPDANMPLFTFISGFVFAYLFSMGHYSDWGVFFSKKVKRLFIPWIILGTIIALTSFEADFAAIGFKYMSYGGGSHLWYILMLFWLFLISWAIGHYELKYFNYFLIVLSFLGPVWLDKIGITMLPWGGYKCIIYYVHFALGVMMYNWMRNHKVTGNKTLLLCMTYGFVFLFLNVINETDLKTMLMSFRCVVFDFMLFFLVTWFIELGFIKESTLTSKISKYSFGIYVFHHWIAWDLYHLDSIKSLFESNYIITAGICTILILILSVLLTKYSLKTKIGKYLLS